MAKKFIVHLKRGPEEITHEVNCDNEISARYICEGLFPEARVVLIMEV